MEKMLTKEEFDSRLAALKDIRHPVLSHGGVTLIDVMGSDRRIADAARTTSNLPGKGDLDDRNLIRYLMRHRHSTPVEFPVVCFLIEMPMDSWRQMIRHRTASVNEFSSRYSEVPDINDETASDRWRLQSKSNRQGSSGDFVAEWPEGYKLVAIGEDGESEIDPGEVPADHKRWAVLSQDEPSGVWFQESLYISHTREQVTPGRFLTDRENGLHCDQRNVYEERLKFGVAKEQARKDLCLSTYTRAFWQNDLHNTLHYLGLRMDSHAQLEIRLFANVMGDILKQLFPVTFQAFVDYRLEAMTLTALDKVVIRNLMQNAYSTGPANRLRIDGGVLHFGRDAFMLAQHEDWQSVKNCRERDECWAKLLNLGIVAEDAQQ